jgi:hypothetical protein
LEPGNPYSTVGNQKLSEVLLQKLEKLPLHIWGMILNFIKAENPYFSGGIWGSTPQDSSQNYAMPKIASATALYLTDSKYRYSGK